jgi:ribonuclease HI
MLHNPNATNNIAKWAAELSEFELDFIPCHTVKSQPHWTLFFNGSTLKQGARAGVLLLTLSGEQFKYMVHLDFKATNNMAEYEALIFGRSTALLLGVRHLLVKGDSQLIIKQVKGDCSCNNPQLATYLLHAWNWKRISRSWTCTTFLVETMQSPMTCQQRPRLGLWSLKVSLKGGCSDLQPSLPNRVKGARSTPQSWRSQRPCSHGAHQGS